MANLDLSANDIEALEKTLAKIVEGRAWLTLEYIFSSWAEFVTSVERGYDESVYEYMNDLSVRDVIQQLFEEIGQAIRVRLERIVSPLDERFFEATRPSKSLGSGNTSEGAWWCRVPWRLRGELKRDLEVLKVI